MKYYYTKLDGTPIWYDFFTLIFYMAIVVLPVFHCVNHSLFSLQSCFQIVKNLRYLDS